MIPKAELESINVILKGLFTRTTNDKYNGGDEMLILMTIYNKLKLFIIKVYEYLLNIEMNSNNFLSLVSSNFMLP